jgi:hypothetical protein
MTPRYHANLHGLPRVKELPRCDLIAKKPYFSGICLCETPHPRFGLSSFQELEVFSMIG